ncbi:MAG TPA: amino acid adenylation domain-containing protein [Candidatus Binatia bacterium]
MVNGSEPRKDGGSAGPTNAFLPFKKTDIEQSISDRFEQQATLYPSQVAIAAEGKSISYYDLNRIANRIAWALLQSRGESHERIALLLEAGDLILAAILGVLKSGNAYVPLDPSAPKIRNQFILQHAQAARILTNSRNFTLAQELGEGEVQLINLDHLKSNFSTNNVGLTISPEAIAYIIYTSGSTGQPKGVVETHRNLLHNVMMNTNTLRICSEDRVTLLRSIGAGGAARDALSALLNGAALCPFSVKEKGLGALAAWLVKEDISIFTTVITVFRHLVASLSGEERFPALRMIYAGGEQVTKRDVELYRRYFPDHCLFVNRLGITETGTVAYFFIDKKTRLTGGAVPVGYPAEDTDILLLDENGNEVGADCVGEITIKSAYVSPGYWRNPEATNSAFLPDPSGGQRRIYRTGDLGRKLSDGCLVHLGWKDFQVNIRGHRIEVLEVETEILNYPGVKEAVVVGREHWSGELRLVAAVVPIQDGNVGADHLRSFLKSRLPDHMIPSAFMLLDELPMGPNGKVDRRALPPTDWLPAQHATALVAARTELEEVIVGIWEATLGLDVIGIHDNFFDLGGHSLLLGQVISKIQAAFKIDVPLDSFLEQPTVAVLADSVRAALRLNQGNIAPITVCERSDRLPLSFAQERLWFLHQLEPNNFSYNFPTATLIDGQLDVAAMQRALNEVVRRHEALRTVIAVSDGQPAQVIIPKLSLKLPVIDLSHLRGSETEAEVSRLISKIAQEPFDLSNAPLLRVILLKLNENRHVFVTVHFLIADGWSIGILFKEISRFYEQYSLGSSSPLPELSIQYADFASWQRQRLQGEALGSEISQWKELLGDRSWAGDLPTDRARPPRQSYRGARQTIVLPRPLTVALKRLSRNESVTMFMILLAAFKTLLYRYSGREDIVIGSPIAGRNRAEVENLIGLFTNTLVLRTDLRSDPSFAELLKRVRENCLKAYAHQDLPFEKLVEELHPNRDLARNPLFQEMFIFQNTPNPVPTIRGLTTHRLEVDGGTSKFDLTLSLSEQNEQLVGSFEYSTDLFNRPTVERIARHFLTLLEGIVADPNQHISELAILSAVEQHQLVIEWNGTAAGYPKDKCIHELFEEQVERTPDAVAVTFEGQQLTYQELNTRANRLAAQLIILDVGPEKLVGICVERSLEMVVGLMGILKAGGGYVPLDPTYPRKRLAFILADAHISVVVTQEKFVESGLLSAISHQPTYVCLDRDWPYIERENAQNRQAKVEPETLAFAIYTSGSTGQPKGVQISHRSVVNCLHSIGQRLGFTDRDVLVAVTTISFDIAALELVLPLLVGGRVVVARRAEATDGRELARRLTESSATAMQGTPSSWRMLIEAGWDGTPGFKILCGGESLSRELAEALLTRGEVWNLYGPTETTIWSAIHKVTSAGGPVPIGRPIANTQLYILDSRLQPIPIGVHGELYIGGDGLARGYLNRPELTKESFIPHPFSDQPGLRLYRTGDRARYLADGNIEFLGRVDNQVKIRGYRIELGEIESALNQHPGVRESAVVVRDRDSLGEKDLVGYFVLTQGSTLSVEELRSFLRGKLPEYMIPSVFMPLGELPITPNGKIDRNALPLPDGTTHDLMHEFVWPRNEIEEMVAQVWREVLKLKTVGVHDNFFELGGHSLVATRVIARLRNKFGIDLSLRKLFELPTVATFAQCIDDLLHNQSGTETPPIVPVPRDRLIPASFAQQRLWFLRQLDPNSTAYNISVVFSVSGPLDVHALEEALNAVIARHEILRTTFEFVDGSLVQNIRLVGGIVSPVTNLEVLPVDAREGKAREIALEEARKPFDLCNGPLLRAQLLRVEVEKHYLLLNVDHTILDGWSMGILFKELGVLYGAYVNREPDPLAPLAVQYADYAVWQRDCLKGDGLESQVQYWTRRVASYSSLSFPTDYPRPALQSSRGVRKTLGLSSQLMDSLKELSRHEGVTLFMTLLAAFKILLSRYSGREDVVVGSTIAGRNRPETEGLIGFFINALPLRTDLSGNPSFLELLRRIREVCLGAYTHQELPFEKIVEAITPNRDLSGNPFFQVMFNMADVSERVLQLQGCEVTKESFFDPEAKFDITLYAPEKDGIIELAIVYSADLFSDLRIAFMLEQFSLLLSQIAEKPDARIGEFSLLLPFTRALLPDPRESLDDTWEGPIHAYVVDWASREPGRIALVDANETWTYCELETRGNQIAHYLIALGIQPNDVVAIYAHRSSTLVPALLGILKAGAVFAILDPTYPPARLTAYLRIARPKGWIQMDGAGELPEELANCLDTLDLTCRVQLPVGKQAVADVLSDHLKTQALVSVNANDPAYIAFTSGSTGEPKGVLSRHGPITHFLPWQKETFGMDETDRFCLLSGLAYNHLHRDIFTSLHLGATLYIPDPHTARSPEMLAGWLRQNEITVLHLTPALGQLLLTAGDKTLPSVRRIFFGGDLLIRQQVSNIRDLAPYAKIGSFYGATETQRAVGYYDIPDGVPAGGDEDRRPIPLGRGIKDVQLLVLNSSGRLAGVGELGELYIRSPHLADGYVGDENLTVERFLTNPFTNDPNDRLYRTGELGRYLPDGNVEWAGRNDRCVNIRGFRVELEEVESVLKQHPVVKAAAVVVREFDDSNPDDLKSKTRTEPSRSIENPKSDARLVAYVAAQEDGPEFIDLLRSFVSKWLPDYMVPAHFLILDDLPVSPNGKIDYQALPPLSIQSLSSPAGSFDAPQTEIEQKLSQIFAQVLGREKVGMNENFFRLGGHSLLAAQAAARIRATFVVGLELRTFLESPTIAALANEIDIRLKHGDATPVTEDADREEIEL